MRLLEIAERSIGKLETTGPNRGPAVDSMRSFVSPSIATNPVAWCASFIFWALRSANGMTRSQLNVALGFSEPWYPESCDSWLQSARDNTGIGRSDSVGAAVVTIPEPGDLFLWMRRQELPGGRVAYSKVDAIHIGFVVAPPTGPGARFPTIEGNTCPEEDGDGRASREGTGVYHRSRTWSPGGIIWIGIPKALKGL